MSIMILPFCWLILACRHYDLSELYQRFSFDSDVILDAGEETSTELDEDSEDDSHIIYSPTNL